MEFENQDKAMANAIISARKIRSHGGRTKVHSGPIHSMVSGRTDHLPVHVKSGSYVIPADIISAMGEGNTMSGFKIAKRLFSSKPYSDSDMPYSGKSSPYDSEFANGGGIDGDNNVPVIVAGGEYVVTPDEVGEVGRGNMDQGHQILDEFVKNFRQKTIKTLKALPGPKKD